ncbi:methylenetetrahydrofolate--tRNA-(uracil(54)-C(5))-methyltransferase (FADH(2)-oxidizing) TrmFO [Geothermobacter hydrogeniphilus]|uniref:Methylenetetrahydrofolate--tRNA-(uracil-5-)-methyltransferase TrmFO n=1 Tax=Geothermobacter hydrogeniphilus TaxID=1969733 RepID=A0A1X0Y3T6_9BACT|nr:methylenetetrahydrofolate--tRNA-(uracil(54)-C(5))-methyltransferase (FADH(2)-oxidizing) TrmFO [Geothermobacter hydrogeniphilus]ORJ59813.1 methylenetetrahydrofolate--tRNA-(uracil(54)-C(5))-methyltransferase (FADH(2)-oxidizing) TrmFO [Geothermobacter hydrogeniphilus]
METHPITVIGAGLAGCEAAWQIARHGLPVVLKEMKPERMSPAHHSPRFCELVCSNSLRGTQLSNAVGLLKEEMRRLRSLFILTADRHAVPAGGALAVARDDFAAAITAAVRSHPLIEVVTGEVTELPNEGWTIVASGPLTSEALSTSIARLTGTEQLYFYDAIAPIVEAGSIDMSVAWRASRYGRGEDDYINCPLNETEYRQFVTELRRAEKVPARDFEKLIHFEGCMPIEEMAERGEMTLAFGPLKPVGLPDPRTGREPFAVLQLRQDDRHGQLYNMVGCQTKLTYPEQRRIFRSLPGLRQAEFARLGSMHRNTFLNAPRCLTPTLQFREAEHLLFAGQITGVEGYVESAACGFLAGCFAARLARGEEISLPPETTGFGALLAHLRHADDNHFQPSNINYGLFPPLAQRIRKRSEKRLALAERALRDLRAWWAEINPERSS